MTVSPDAKTARQVGRGKLVRHLPNVVTVARVLLVLPTGWLLWHGATLQALLLIAIAGLSDAVDGELARRFDWRTRFGAFADPAADKLLMLVVFVILTIQGLLPIWLLVVVVGRDLVIIAGALAYRLLFGGLTMAPTALSKANTALQIVMLLLLLVAQTSFPWAANIAAAVDPAGFFVVGVSGVLSGTQYVITWGRRAVLEHRRRQALANDEAHAG